MLRFKLASSIIASRVRLKSTIADLQVTVRDPNSPPGSNEASKTSSFVTQQNELEKAYQKMLENGFDPLSFWEQRICWGDQDSYQHVNNARMARFFESSRVKWMTTIGEELGGPQKGLDMLKGRGVAHILKSIEIRFRRPVTYPDMVLVGYRPNIPSELVDRTVLLVTAKAYSVQQQAFVAIANEVLVWYDYDKLKKCDPGDKIWNIVRSVVKIFVVSPDTRSERRFDLHLTVENLKSKLEPVTGIPAANQIITLFDSETTSNVKAILNDDTKQLGFYGLQDWQVLKVEDSDPSVSFTGQLSDTSQVEKFEISEAEYAKRTDSVLAYKQRHQVGRFAPQDEAKDAKPKIPNDITVGARCEVESTEEELHKRGTVRYVGETKFAKGVWIGIEYDEPFGKNDGSIQGERYFTCSPKYGVFVRPDKVKVGDYPVEELNVEDEEM